LDGVAACLNAGANDLGGTLMNESITRAAGASYGQEWTPQAIEDTIRNMERLPRMRNTLYASAPNERHLSANNAQELHEIELNSAAKKQRTKKLENLAHAI
jgi:FO synthase